MFIIHPWVCSWREFNVAFSQAARNLQLHSLGIIHRGVSHPQYKSLSNSLPELESNQLNFEEFICPHSLFNKLNISDVVNSLNKNGFALGINLPQEIVLEILNSAKDTLCYGNNNSSLGFYYSEKEQAQIKYGRSFSTGYYDRTAFLCSAIKRIESEPLLLQIATQYLESEAIHEESQIWWNFPVESTVYERRRAAQMFHRESGERRCLQFCFYITNVDLCSSPHICVRGSHQSKSFSRLYRLDRLSYQEVVQYYGYQTVIPICGKAGAGFVEDPRCFHKKSPPGSKDRLTLKIKFSAKS